MTGIIRRRRRAKFQTPSTKLQRNHKSQTPIKPQIPSSNPGYSSYARVGGQGGFGCMVITPFEEVQGAARVKSSKCQTMKLSPRYLKRYKDIGVLVMKYGEPEMVSRFAAEAEPKGVAGQSNGAELPDDLEKLGPTFVKLGQLLSSRADLLPQRYLKPLSRLQDRVKPFPYADVEFIVETELRTSINKAFSYFQREPLAAASLGQVHLAALHDGRPVAVKVQRPNVAKQIEQDFAALEELARFMDRHTQFGQRYQLPKILEEFQNTLAHELDYRREAANLMTLNHNLREF